jgi:hypothetical protein
VSRDLASGARSRKQLGGDRLPLGHGWRQVVCKVPILLDLTSTTISSFGGEIALPIDANARLKRNVDRLMFSEYV